MRVEEGRLACGPPRCPCRRCVPLPVPCGSAAGGDSVRAGAYAVFQHEASNSAISRRGPVPLASSSGPARSGSIAAVVRELIDAERARRADPAADPLLRFLVDESPGRGREGTSVTTLDRDLYGS